MPSEDDQATVDLADDRSRPWSVPGLAAVSNRTFRGTMTEADWDNSALFLVQAERLDGTRVQLWFEDGFTGVVDLALIVPDWIGACLRDLCADGDNLEICRTAYNIDSVVLRARCDPQYAALLKADRGAYLKEKP